MLGSSVISALGVAALLDGAAARPHGNEAFLNVLARADQKLWFGTAADIPGPELQDEGYMDILTDRRIIGEITPANYMKVRSTNTLRTSTD